MSKEQLRQARRVKIVKEGVYVGDESELDVLILNVPEEGACVGLIMKASLPIPAFNVKRGERVYFAPCEVEAIIR